VSGARGSAVKLVAVYWALLVFGMALYTALRIDAVDALTPVWVGAVGGTILGQVLAFRRYRAWLAILVILTTAIFVLPQLPEDLSRTKLWMAFLPAALSGYWSLGDRTSLAAFWFPAMIWMLSVLDGTDANAMPDHTGLILLGALAAMFVVYLRVREERRISLWRTVAPLQLAVVKPQVILKERTAPQLARAAWAILVGTLGFAATAWLAPALWQKETFGHHHTQVIRHSGVYATHGLPCCPRATDDADTSRSRVKEYLDIGRGHDKIEATHRPGIDCQWCRHTTGGPAAVDVQISSIDPGPGVPVGDYGYSSTARGTGGYYEGGAIDPAQTIHRDIDSPVEVRSDPWATSALDPRYPAPSTPTFTGPTVNPYAHDVVVPPPPDAVAVHDQVQAGPLPAPPVPKLDPPVVPADDKHEVQPPPAEAATHDPADVEAEPPASARPPSHAGALALNIIGLVVASLVMIQLVALALRPLRRMLTLRHLRAPFWPETVDQRVSNAWQLALIGLRDAGYRASMHEPPAALARRVNVEGVGRCATILERARHGIGIDRDDLADMTTTANGVYHTARARTGRIRRAMSWLRWPLA
jgi:hypothetical protein